MAYVVAGNGSGYFLTMTVQDRNLDTATLTYELRAADEAEAITQTATIIAKFDAVSQAVVTGYHIQKRYWNDSIGTPAAGELQIKARCSFQLKDSPEKETFDIPAPKETIFYALTGTENKKVNVAATPVTEYADLFRDAGVAFISDGESLELLIQGRKVSSKSGFRAR